MDNTLKAVDPDEILVWVRAYRTCKQLQAWREKGYKPELIGDRDGWMLTLNTERYEAPTQEQRMSLRFTTGVHPTPEAAIEAALGMIQP